MRILIADDDRLVRYSLKSMLAEVLHQPDIHEARNGKELVERFSLLAPDIVFVDINMPVMDGISAIEQCVALDIPTQFVVLTAYADFEYAKRCIPLGVREYLLKPVSPQQLKKLFLSLEKEVQSSDKAQLEQYQNMVYSLFQQGEPSGFTQQDSRNKIMLCTFFINSRTEEKAQTSAGRLMETILLQGLAYARKDLWLAAVKGKENTLHLIALSGEGENLLYYIDKAGQLCRDVSKEGCCVNAICFFPQSFEDALGKARWTEANRFIYLAGKPEKATPWEKAAKIAEHKHTSAFLLQIAGLLQDYTQADSVKYQHGLRLLAKEFPELPELVRLSTIGDFVSKSLAVVVEKKNYNGFLQSLSKLAVKMPEPEKLPKGSKISNIQNYIAQNYMKDISVAEVARQFGLTPNYMSSLFHTKTGKRFVDYLSEVRVNNAQNILDSDPETPVKTLAEMVGYTSARHFTGVFKKITGYYPSEYKLQNRANQSVDSFPLQEE